MAMAETVVVGMIIKFLKKFRYKLLTRMRKTKKVRKNRGIESNKKRAFIF